MLKTYLTLVCTIFELNNFPHLVDFLKLLWKLCSGWSTLFIDDFDADDGPLSITDYSDLDFSSSSCWLDFLFHDSFAANGSLSSALIANRSVCARNTRVLAFVKQSFSGATKHKSLCISSLKVQVSKFPFQSLKHLSVESCKHL